MRFGAGMLVPLQSAPQGAPVKVVCALWSWPAGAAAGCFRVVRFCKVPLKGAASGCCC